MPYTGTYGTNGFYPNFKDNTSTTTIGYDYSGNANNWTANNISLTAGATYDSMLDVPTPWVGYSTTTDTNAVTRGNYGTWNPISNTASANVTFSNANLQVSIVSSSGGRGITATQEMRSGKWYAEFVVSSWGSSNNADIGILRSDTTVMTTSSYALAGAIGTYLANGYAINQNGGVYNNGSALATGLTTFNTTDIVQIAYAYRDWETDRKSTRLNSSHSRASRMPSSA